LIWRQQNADRTNLSPEVAAIQQDMTRRMNAADAKAGTPMASIYRRYLGDHEVRQAANEAEKMWAENREKLLRALR